MGKTFSITKLGQNAKACSKSLTARQYLVVANALADFLSGIPANIMDQALLENSRTLIAKGKEAIIDSWEKNKAIVFTPDSCGSFVFGEPPVDLHYNTVEIGSNETAIGLLGSAMLVCQEATDRQLVFTADVDPGHLVRTFEIYREITGQKAMLCAEAYLATFQEDYRDGLMSELGTLGITGLCSFAVLPDKSRRDWQDEVLEGIATFEEIPEKHKTADFCLAVVKKDPNQIRLVPQSMRNSEICEIAVRQSPSNITHVPRQMITDRMYAEVVKAGMAFSLVPVDRKTPELCRLAVEANVWNIKSVPEEVLDREMIEKAVTSQPMSINFVRHSKLVDTDLCIKAIKCLPKRNMTKVFAQDMAEIMASACDGQKKLIYEIIDQVRPLMSKKNFEFFEAAIL